MDTRAETRDETRDEMGKGALETFRHLTSGDWQLGQGHAVPYERRAAGQEAGDAEDEAYTVAQVALEGGREVLLPAIWKGDDEYEGFVCGPRHWAEGLLGDYLALPIGEGYSSPEYRIVKVGELSRRCGRGTWADAEPICTMD